MLERVLHSERAVARISGPVLPLDELAATEIWGTCRKGTFSL